MATRERMAMRLSAGTNVPTCAQDFAQKTHTQSDGSERMATRERMAMRLFAGTNSHLCPGL